MFDGVWFEFRFVGLRFGFVFFRYYILIRIVLVLENGEYRVFLIFVFYLVRSGYLEGYFRLGVYFYGVIFLGFGLGYKVFFVGGMSWDFLGRGRGL